MSESCDVTTETRKLAKIWINPFIFFAEEKTDLLTEKRILEFLLGIEGQEKLDIQEIISRYREIRLHKTIQMLPNIPTVIDKIMKPLAEAQRSYMLGQWLSTISLCGTVGEILTSFIWDIRGTRLVIGACHLETKKDEEQTFGKTFHNLDQIRKLQVLQVAGFLKEETYKLLEELRNLRNGYIHFSKPAHEETMKADAKRSIDIIISTIQQTLGLEWVSGEGYRFDPELLRHLESLGAVTEVPAHVPPLFGLVAAQRVIKRA